MCNLLQPVASCCLLIYYRIFRTFGENVEKCNKGIYYYASSQRQNNSTSQLYCKTKRYYQDCDENNILYMLLCFFLNFFQNCISKITHFCCHDLMKEKKLDKIRLNVECYPIFYIFMLAGLDFHSSHLVRFIELILSRATNAVR